MKRNISFLNLLIGIAILSSCNNKPASNDTETSKKSSGSASASVEELGQMNRDFAKFLTARDAAATANLYDENASILPPNSTIVKGRANIQTYWQAVIDANLIDGSVKTIDAKSDGNLGYEIGAYTMRFKGEKGDTIVDNGKYTEVLKFDSASGKWMAIYGMWSSDSPAH